MIINLWKVIVPIAINETNSKMRKINCIMYLYTVGMQKGKMESDEACYDVTKGLQSNKHLCQHSNTHTKTRFFRLESLLFKSSLGRAIKQNRTYYIYEKDFRQVTLIWRKKTKELELLLISKMEVFDFNWVCTLYYLRNRLLIFWNG